MLFNKSIIEAALIAGMSQICQCTLDLETVRFNGSLYCSQDSWSVYEGHVEGVFSGILMETDFMLTIKNYTITPLKCSVIISNQSEIHCKSPTDSTINIKDNTTIATNYKILTNNWNNLSPFLIGIGICIALTAVVVGIVIYRKGCFKHSIKNSFKEER